MNKKGLQPKKAYLTKNIKDCRRSKNKKKLTSQSVDQSINQSVKALE